LLNIGLKTPAATAFLSDNYATNLGRIGEVTSANWLWPALWLQYATKMMVNIGSLN
jgi:hypothetical protein